MISIGYSQVITVAFRHPYLWDFKEDSIINTLREVLKQEKIKEVRDHAKYRIYIGGLQEDFITKKEGFKIKVEKGNISIYSQDNIGLMNGIIYIAEKLKKTHSLAGIKSKE